MTDGRRQPRRHGTPVKHRATYLSDVAYAQAKALADRAGVSYSEFIEDLITAEYKANTTRDEEE